MGTAEDRTGRQIVYRPEGAIDILLGDGEWVTLPRPTFGQIKPLIRTQGRIQDELQTLAYAALAQADEVIKAERELRTGGMSMTEQLGPITELRNKAREAADVAEEATGESLAGWWRDVFELLAGIGKVPDEEKWPSIFMDPKIPTAMVNHWRFVPTGPG